MKAAGARERERSGERQSTCVASVSRLRCRGIMWWVSEIRGTLLGVPYTKDDAFLGIFRVPPPPRPFLEMPMQESTRNAQLGARLANRVSQMKVPDCTAMRIVASSVLQMAQTSTTPTPRI